MINFTYIIVCTFTLPFALLYGGWMVFTKNNFCPFHPYSGKFYWGVLLLCRRDVFYGFSLDFFYLFRRVWESDYLQFWHRYLLRWCDVIICFTRGKWNALEVPNWIWNSLIFHLLNHELLHVILHLIKCV